MISHLSDIDLSKIVEEEDMTSAREEVACAGGLCTIDRI